MEKKRINTTLKAYLDKSPIVYTTPLHATDRAYILHTDTLRSDVLTKLVSLGVHTFTSISNRGLQHILIEY